MPDALIEAPQTRRKRVDRNGGHPVKSDQIDVGKALKLRLAGHSFELIGQVLKPDKPYSRQAIQQCLKPFELFLKNPEAVEAYKDNKAPLLESVELTLISDLLDEDKRQKASLNNVAYAYQQVASGLRAERGPVGMQLSIPGTLQQAFTVAITVGPIEKAQGEVIEVNPQPEPTTHCGLDPIENP